ncbi:MAG: TrkH family potassium uptake protein [Planctomycetaceae bacterium]
MKKPASRRRWQPNRGVSMARWDASLQGDAGAWQKITPPQIFVGSFLLLIFLGTIGFMVLPGIHANGSMSWIDSLFTSTSAVCVTGLVISDTATQFTFRGQVFLLLLIQLGGLGMLAFTSLVIQVLGFRLSLRTESLTHEPRKGGPRVDLRRLTLDVVLFTFFFEAAGALALWLTWGPKVGWAEAWWPSLFHAVSGFCNAGFSTRSDSLVGLQESPATLLIISALIISGGIGFIAMEEAALCFSRRHRSTRMRLSVQTRLVLVTTLVLVVVPWPMFAFFEWHGALRDLAAGDKLINALFISVTARTAGFNSIDYELASDSTNFLTVILMTIGGSPGSTAGGMKTTTFALIILLAWSRIRGSETTVFANRSIPNDTTQRAIGLAVVAVAVMTLGVFALAVTESAPDSRGYFMPRMFEAVSAFNTVGLSMNLTPDLTFAGRMVIILLMFLGRVGPLTLAAALIFSRRRRASFRFAYEDVVVG